MESVPVCVWTYLAAGIALLVYQLTYDWREVMAPDPELWPAVDAAIVIVGFIIYVLIWPVMPWIEAGKE